MTYRLKATCYLLPLIACFGIFPTFAQAQTELKIRTDTVQTYAGPQTVTPGQVIHVTVEVTQRGGISAQNENVELSYFKDGTKVSITGFAQDGLTSFDIKAQTQSGMMDFVARFDDVISKAASVMVSAGTPTVFDLIIKKSSHSQSINISSDVIVDAFGNAISDQTLVSLDWVDPQGVRSSENIQLSNGRILFVSRCPVKFTSPLRIKAILKNRDVMSSDVSTLCKDWSV